MIQNRSQAARLISLMNMIIILINSWPANEPPNQAREHKDINKWPTMQAYSWRYIKHTLSWSYLCSFTALERARDVFPVSRWMVYFYSRVLQPALAITLDCKRKYDKSWLKRMALKCWHCRVNLCERGAQSPNRHYLKTRKHFRYLTSFRFNFLFGLSADAVFIV